MNTITVSDKPVMGRIDRVCLNCGDNYNGWHMYTCRDCRNNCVIVEEWTNVYR